MYEINNIKTTWVDEDVLKVEVPWLLTKLWTYLELLQDSSRLEREIFFENILNLRPWQNNDTIPFNL